MRWSGAGSLGDFENISQHEPRRVSRSKFQNLLQSSSFMDISTSSPATEVMKGGLILLNLADERKAAEASQEVRFV